MSGNPFIDAVRAIAGTASTGTGGGAALGKVVKDIEHDGEVWLQGDGMPLNGDDLVFADGLRKTLTRGDSVFMVRSANGQTYYVLTKLEG